MVCSYEELQGMCNGVHVWQLFRHSSSPFKGTMQHQDGTTTDVMIHWQTVARADQEPSRFREWLDEMSQLQHPHVLPLIGACLDPPAIVVPFMQVCFSSACTQCFDWSIVQKSVFYYCLPL